MHYSDIINGLIGKEKALEFALWALGDEFRDFRRDEVWIVWNFRHGDKLKLHANGMINVDIPKMIEIWKKDTKQ